MNKTFTVAIIGVGNRGADRYGKIMTEELSEQFHVVALCDINPDKLTKYAPRLGVPAEQCFTDEETFWQEKRADLCIIATPDALHTRMARRAIAVGYRYILLEKPISADREELLTLEKEAEEAGATVMVCHVLRYTASTRKIRQILDAGKIGKLVMVDSLEQVAFWHFTHSFVRGNWRNTKETSPSIIAKCCHDLDLMQYYAGAKCTAVSSMGSLTHFKAENRPEGAADRCLDCPYKHTCSFSATRMYLDNWKLRGCKDMWPFSVITDKPLSEETITEALRLGDWGRCVYACDNDAADNQAVLMQFENGVVANLRMMAFTQNGGRITRFFGTEGEIEYNETENYIETRTYDMQKERVSLTSLADDLSGHGGGDTGLVHTVYDVLCGKSLPQTSLSASVESHLMGIAAEESRLAGGALVQVHA